MFEITPVGLILIAYIIGCRLKKCRDYLVEFLIKGSILSFFFINIGYVFKIGDFEFTYIKFFLLIIPLAITLDQSKEIKFVKKDIMSYVLVSIVVIIGYSINLLSGNIELKTIIGLLEFLLFLYFIICIKTQGFFLEEKGKKYIDFFIKSFLVFCICMAVEMIIVYFTNDGRIFREFLFSFFGKNRESIVTYSYRRSGLYMLMGTLAEPSHIGFMIFAMGLIMFNDKRIKIRYLILMSIISIMSTSSTTMIIIIIWGTIIIFSRLNIKKRLKHKTIITIITGSCLTFLISIKIFSSIKERIIDNLLKIKGYISQLFNISLQGNYLVDSGRVDTIENAMSVFKQKILLGNGMGSIRALSFNSALLANVGVIGFLFYYIYIFIISDIKLNFKVLINVFIIIVFNFFIGYNVALISMFVPFCIVIIKQNTKY